MSAFFISESKLPSYIFQSLIIDTKSVSQDTFWAKHRAPCSLPTGEEDSYAAVPVHVVRGGVHTPQSYVYTVALQVQV